MRFLRAYAAELLVALAILGAWGATTASVVIGVTTPAGRVFLSLGLLLFSLVGWKFLYVLFRDGVYARTKETS